MDLQEVSPGCSFFSSILHPEGRSSIRERHPLHGYKKSIEQIRFSGNNPGLFFRVVPADAVADGLTPVPKFDSYGLSITWQSALNRCPFPLRSVHVQRRTCSAEHCKMDNYPTFCIERFTVGFARAPPIISLIRR